MRILFCNIAWMKEYRGNEDGNDTPLNGGSYVDETGDAHEKYNFFPIHFEGDEDSYCLGFFETKSHNGKDVNQMHIENIAGCELCKKEESVEDVLVVYCAQVNGKTERGLNYETAGTLSVVSGLKISYISQETSHLRGTLKAYAEKNDIDYTLLLTLLRQLDFSRVQFGKDMIGFDV